jgi:hypothetical protein
VDQLHAGYHGTERHGSTRVLCAEFMSEAQFRASKKFFAFFLDAFMSPGFFDEIVGLGLSEIMLKEKEINSLTQTAFYTSQMMQRQAWRNEYEFEKECINQMARSTLRQHSSAFTGACDMAQKYQIVIKVGYGFTYSKYNTLMHFLNVAECYWHNPDLNSIQVFGKDIRAVLVVSCQKSAHAPPPSPCPCPMYRALGPARC